MTLGILHLKYRDLGRFFEPLLRGMFFLTPVFWDPSIVTGTRRALVDFNPFYYFLELLRAPLLGYVPETRVWAVCGTITLLGFLATALLYRFQRPRLAYWL
jgi:ABC-2 type transport system permease protein/lipopolysaccharide transport system permease protein